MSGTVISLFDHSGLAVRPWADEGFRCYCLDILHPGSVTRDGITFVGADLNHDSLDWYVVDSVMTAAARRGGRLILFGWPPCEDLTVSGNRHLAGKRLRDPWFQEKAAARAKMCGFLGDRHGFSWLVENPIGGLCRLWRQPDRIWHPYHFGGYLPPEAEHPVWPKYIAPQDAYTKVTGAWLGGDFRWPPKKEVVPEILDRMTASGRIIRGSRQFMFLGGSSRRTKEIRNLTPRGAATAFYLSNRAP